jgi:hypothetical protein
MARAAEFQRDPDKYLSIVDSAYIIIASYTTGYATLDSAAAF